LNQTEIRDCFLKEAARETFATEERFLEEPLLTANKKRVLLIVADPKSAEIQYEIPVKSFEVWALLLRNLNDGTTSDFILPQKVFSQHFAKAKKSLKKDEKIPVTVRKDGERFLLSIHESEPIDITEFLSNYEPLK
jgi:hypothetical protein